MRKIALLATVLGLLLAVSVSVAAAQTTRTLVAFADLSGSEEVPPVATTARGLAVYRLNPDGMTLRYTLVAVGLTSQPLFAHIHSPAPRGANAGVVTFLTPPQNGNAVCARTTPLVLSCHGVITAANLQGSLAGQPLSALIDRMVAGQTYTNVHTALPGGFPSGEVRGQNDVTVNVTR